MRTYARSMSGSVGQSIYRFPEVPANARRTLTTEAGQGAGYRPRLELQRERARAIVHVEEATTGIIGAEVEVAVTVKIPHCNPRVPGILITAWVVNAGVRGVSECAPAIVAEQPHGPPNAKIERPAVVTVTRSVEDQVAVAIGVDVLGFDIKNGTERAPAGNTIGRSCVYDPRGNAL